MAGDGMEAGRSRYEGAIALLESTRTAGIEHPGGTLGGHLRRVHDLLAAWGARPDLRLAGLCHAFYGTDGFPTALGDVGHRDGLSAIIGSDAEELVYFYGSCDRSFSYPHLHRADGPFRDRFTGATELPSRRLRADFAELTVANELDIVSADPEFLARHGLELGGLFGLWRSLLSEPAWKAASTLLPVS